MIPSTVLVLVLANDAVRFIHIMRIIIIGPSIVRGGSSSIVVCSSTSTTNN